MRYTCTAKCMFGGDICKPGTVLDIDPATVPAADAAVFKSSFTAESPAPEVKTPKGGKAPKKLANGLTREQAVAKLESSGFAVPDSLTDAELDGFYAKAFQPATGTASPAAPAAAPVPAPPSVLDGGEASPNLEPPAEGSAPEANPKRGKKGAE